MNIGEIEFRAKRSYDKEWIYGSLLRVDGNYHLVKNDDMREDGHHITQNSDNPTWIDEDTIGQYRGKKDKNKNKIYDGDIVEYYDYDLDFETGDIEFSLKQYVVGYEDDFVVFNPIPDLERLADIYNVDISELTEDDNKYVGLNVIGNKYDNPELIDE